MSAIRRVGILFAGGPAPGANAVISAVAMSFVEDGVETLGFFHGYSNLQEYDSKTRPLVENQHYRVFERRDFSDLRNSRGVIVGTSRVGPGEHIRTLSDLDDPSKTTALANVYQALADLKIDALISIGGDGTLRAANLLYHYQQRLPEASHTIRVVHVPKTIDNDYNGIDFTFGYFTAIDVMAKELQNLRADAMATSSYFIAETMGRKAGWVSYGVAIAGEANLVFAPEDVHNELMVDGRLSPNRLAEKIVDLMIHREKIRKFYGTVVLAEGLAELLPDEFHTEVPKNLKGNLRLGKTDFGRTMARMVADLYEERVGRKKKVTGVQLGYESRSALPHAYDVLLASQLGIGAYRALTTEELDGHMVSVAGQFRLHYVPFSELCDENTLETRVRFMRPGSDFHRLARALETRVDTEADWTAGRRHEE